MKMFGNKILVTFIILNIFIIFSKVNSLKVFLSHNGPVIRGGNITFQAYLEVDRRNVDSNDTERFQYKWIDDTGTEGKSLDTQNTTSSYSIVCQKHKYSVGKHSMKIEVCQWFFKIVCLSLTEAYIEFEVTAKLNGYLSIKQENAKFQFGAIAANTLTNLRVDIKKTDLDFIKQEATSILTYWFINCKAYNQSHNENITYYFTASNYIQIIQALVIASYDPPSSSGMPPIIWNSTLSNESLLDTGFALLNHSNLKSNDLTLFGNCIDLNQVAQKFSKSNNIYGYFQQEIEVRDLITSIIETNITELNSDSLIGPRINCFGLLRKGFIQLDDKFQVTIDVQQFKHDELDVEIANTFLIIIAKHEVKEDELGWISGELKWKYIVSENWDINEVVAELSSDGVLRITAPKKDQTALKNKRKIKIRHTEENYYY